MDGFSTEEQRALEIVENLSMPKNKKNGKIMNYEIYFEFRISNV